MADIVKTDEGEISQDQLVILLKERKKETDKMKKMLTKMETKYVSIHESKQLLQ